METGTQQPRSSLVRHPASDPTGPLDALMLGRPPGLLCTGSLVLLRRGDVTGETGLGEMGTDLPCRRPCALQTLSTQEDRRRGGDWAAGSCGQALHARAQSRQRCYARGGRDSMVSRPEASVAAPQPPRRVVTQRGREATEAVVRRSFVDSEEATELPQTEGGGTHS